MVILAHALKFALSNSAESLTLLLDDNRFSGLGKLFWLNLVKNFTKTKLLIISDPRLVQYLQGQEVTCLFPKQQIDLSIFEDPRVIFLDSLEVIIWIAGEKKVFEALENRCRMGLGTVIACNKSYCNGKTLENFLSLAEIIVSILDFKSNQGTVKCVHLRGYVKNTEEISAFVMEGENIKEVKISQASGPQKAPKTTFKLGISEEEKKMKDSTPLPYEKFHPVINFNPAEYDSPDEEGDDDVYYE